MSKSKRASYTRGEMLPGSGFFCFFVLGLGFFFFDLAVRVSGTRDSTNDYEAR